MEHLSFAQAQERQMNFLHRLNLNTTIETQGIKFVEETQEGLEALAILQSDYTSEHEKAFALEIIDIIIVGIGLIGEMNLDAEKLILEKFAINELKYDWMVARELQAQGMTPLESMRELKKRWNNPIDFEI